VHTIQPYLANKKKEPLANERQVQGSGIARGRSPQARKLAELVQKSIKINLCDDRQSNSPSPVHSANRSTASGQKGHRLARNIIGRKATGWQR